MTEHDRIRADLAAILHELGPARVARLHPETWSLLEHLRGDPRMLAAVVALIGDQLRHDHEVAP